MQTRWVPSQFLFFFMLGFSFLIFILIYVYPLEIYFAPFVLLIDWKCSCCVEMN